MINHVVNKSDKYIHNFKDYVKRIIILDVFNDSPTDAQCQFIDMALITFGPMYFPFRFDS